MKKSFDGHPIGNRWRAAGSTNEITLNEKASSSLSDNQLNIISQLGIEDWEQVYSLFKVPTVKKHIKQILQTGSEESLKLANDLVKSNLPEERIALLNKPVKKYKLGAKRPPSEIRLAARTE